VVDDDPDITDGLADALRCRDHEVTAVNDPREALRLAAAGGFDLVITDYNMPRMNGVALAQAIAQSAHPTLVVLHTGSSKNIIRARDSAYGGLRQSGAIVDLIRKGMLSRDEMFNLT